MAGSLKMNVYASLGCFNIVHINTTQTGPQGCVILMQGDDRTKRERERGWCHVKSENYYCTAHSHVWKGMVMVCHLQLLGSNIGVGGIAVANFICTGFSPNHPPPQSLAIVLALL